MRYIEHGDVQRSGMARLCAERKRGIMKDHIIISLYARQMVETVCNFGCE